jgi:outer membrane protein OmpA-like peptidoglycan-associated protein
MDKVKKQAEAVQNAQVETTTDANGLECVRLTFNENGIKFATGSATLTAASQNVLMQLASVLKQNTDCDVAIQGYTDNAGWKNSTAEQSAQKNMNLSQQRAQSVTNYLQTQGVSANQIRSTMGYGEANPVADNSTAAGKAQNRRVEVYMYASQAMIQAAEQGTLQ